MDPKKATDESSSQTAPATAQAPATAAATAPATEQAEVQRAIDPAFAPLGEFTANHLNRLIRSHRHPTIKTDLREVEVLEVMPDARLKVVQQNASDNEEHFYINLDAASFDMLLSTLTS
ncbi:MAG TPA: hypothetical protein VGC91_07980 [Pyrinomonadaceae bacterium]|jgi:hypothetical protein